MTLCSIKEQIDILSKMLVIYEGVKDGEDLTKKQSDVVSELLENVGLGYKVSGSYLASVFTITCNRVASTHPFYRTILELVKLGAHCFCQLLTFRCIHLPKNLRRKLVILEFWVSDGFLQSLCMSSIPQFVPKLTNQGAHM